MLELLSNGFRVSALFLLVAFGTIFYGSEKYDFRKNIVLFFLWTVSGFLLAYWEPVQSSPVVFRVSFFLSVTLPVAFWLTSKSLFDDNFQWNAKYWFIVIGASLLINGLYAINEYARSQLVQYIGFVPYLISVFFIILVIYEALKNKEGDLVLSRLKRRNVFVLFSSILALLSVYFFFVEDPLKLPAKFELLQNFVICIFIFQFFYSQFQYKSIFVEKETAIKKENTDVSAEIHKRIVTKLLAIFDEDKIYTREGITITQLADLVNEKEYLLRRAINGELGYTNFNSFLNQYRINEAIRLLQNSKDKELTFQEVAYATGYQSVATFNRAFKKQTGQTPSQYFGKG